MAEVGIILGSGLKKFVEDLNSPVLIHSDENSFHKKKVYKSRIEGVETLIFSGRSHYYENPGTDKIFESVEICKENSVKLLIISNAAGGINNSFKVSDLMLITSFIDLINAVPISYKHTSTEKKNNLVSSLAIENGIELKKGVYLGLTGPNYETQSEIKFVRKLGADAVGMSTVPEIKYARTSGIKVIAISCITNLLKENPLLITSHEEVEKAGDDAYQNFSKLLRIIIKHKNEFLK